MAKRVRLFGAIQKVDVQDDGSLIVSGVASSETVDGEGEVVKADAMRGAIPAYMKKSGAVREMHQPIAAGAAIAIRVDDDGVTHFECLVKDTGSIGKITCDPPVLKGFSIGGKVTERDPLNKKIITGLSLVEISLVDVPCNPDAVFAMAKFDTPEDEVDEPESTETTQKGMAHVADLAWLLKQIQWLTADQIQEAAREGDSSPVPSKIKAWLAAGGVLLAEMTAEEVAELVTALPDAAPEAVGADVVNYAAGTDGVEKKGAKFSQSSKDALDTAHKGAMDAHKQMGSCLKALGAVWAEGGENGNTQASGGNNDAQGAGAGSDDTSGKAQLSEAITKAASLTDELAKVTTEKESLQKALDSISADFKTTKDALAKAEADLKVKGAKQAVPIEKGKESTALGAADEPKPSTDPLDIMKSVQGQPVNLIFNPR